MYDTGDIKNFNITPKIQLPHKCNILNYCELDNGDYLAFCEVCRKVKFAFNIHFKTSDVKNEYSKETLDANK